jgi:hypothetical protein
MRSVLGLAVALALALGGMTVAGLVPALQSSALAQKAQESKQESKQASKKQRSQRGTVPQTTGFEHQQCSIQNPCSTRNQH